MAGDFNGPPLIGYTAPEPLPAFDSMKPIIALVGRPNVGKSTLFNRLTRTRDAIVHDLPGLTRDRHYGHGVTDGKAFLVIDTGGFEPVAKDGIMHEMARQTQLAIDEADVVLFIVDGRGGLTSQDRQIADLLRRTGRQVFVAVNKAEGMRREVVEAEFHELGLGEPHAISAAHGEGVRELIALALAPFEAGEERDEAAAGPDRVRIAIVGRPNVGKSTLVNALLGEERVIAFDQPGTTRDAIHLDFDRGDRHYTLIDTAGVRRKGRVFEAVEKFSVIKTLQAIEEANVVVLLLDARQDIADQDAHLAGFILEAGRALVLGVNKWDGLDTYRRDEIKREISRRLAFLSYARLHTISALETTGLKSLMDSVDAAYAAATAKLSTPRLNRVLRDAVARHEPPHSGLFRPKPRYAHQGGMNPPIVVIHGNALKGLGADYLRYLENTFRQAFKLQGTPLRIELREGANPFEDRKPKPLTEREKNKIRREKRFRRRKYGSS
jgi:GTP-binding protein